MEYQGIQIFDAKDREMLIMSNLSDVQELIAAKQYREANERINAVKKMMIATRELVVVS